MKNLVLALHENKEFSLYKYHDDTYGCWRERFLPVDGGYVNVIGGYDNWSYCPICGIALSSFNECHCDEDATYALIKKADVYKIIRSFLENGFNVDLNQ